MFVILVQLNKFQFDVYYIQQQAYFNYYIASNSIRNNVIMNAFGVPNKKQDNLSFKLPKIQSRQNIELPQRKKSPSKENHLPKLKVQFTGPEKENINFQNLQQLKNQRQNNIKEGIQAIKQAELKVKNLFGDPQATTNLGEQMTNFQYNVDKNRQIIKNFRNQNHIKIEQDKMMNKIQQLYKNKSLTFQQKNNNKKQESIKKVQLDLRENSYEEDKNESVQKHNIKEIFNFKSQRKVKINQKLKKQKQFKVIEKKQKQIQNQTVFVSIKQILENPCKNDKQTQSKVQFSIKQLQNKLKKLSSADKNQINSYRKQSEKFRSNKQLNSGQQSVRDWVRIQLSNEKKSLKCLKSDFDQQINHIKVLQQKSYKSIQNMVENRKLLIQLNLRNKLKKQ